MIDSAAAVSRQRIRGMLRRVADRVAPPPVILMYHSIAKDEIDPWQLCVSPKNFVTQMEFIRRRRRPMRLAELAEQLARGRCPRDAVVVTFDDGYRDNLLAALPVLQAFDVPATVFCTSGFIGRDDAFWWDRLAGLLLRPAALPPVLTFDGGGKHRRFELGNADGQNAPSSRLQFYREVWAWLRSLSEADRSASLAQIATWSGADAFDAPQPLSREQLRQLSASPLIEIGAHSVTHAALSALSPAAQREEIVQSKAQLETLVGRAVTSFAYPFGDLSDETAALVREAGFASSCTTEARVIRAGTDLFRLPRMAVHDRSNLADTLRDHT